MQATVFSRYDYVIYSTAVITEITYRHITSPHKGGKKVYSRNSRSYFTELNGQHSDKRVYVCVKCDDNHLPEIMDLPPE